jgi:hypothetical protein
MDVIGIEDPELMRSTSEVQYPSMEHDPRVMLSLGSA